MPCACRSASSSEMLREPFSHGSAAPSASWRKAFIAVAFAVSSVAWSRSLRMRLAWMVDVNARATRSPRIAAAAATPSLWRPASLRNR